MTLRYEWASLALRIWSLTALAQFKGAPWVLRVEKWLWYWKTETYFLTVEANDDLRGW